MPSLSWKCSQAQGCFQERKKKKKSPYQCHDHSSLLMWLIISVSSTGFCCSDLALDTSLGVNGDIIPITISSKPATQFIHKSKCTHYQVRWKNTKTHPLPHLYSFLNQRPRCHPKMCHWQPQEGGRREAVKNNSWENHGCVLQWENCRKSQYV